MKKMLVALVAAGIGIGLTMLALVANAAVPVSTEQTASGSILVDENRMTLYTFARDTAMTSNCNGKCAERWIPLEAFEGDQAEGDYQIFARSDGAKQWAYKGKPLYLYDGDESPGDAKGDGMGGMWKVARP
ncbi:MAG: hypothetical protein HY342_09300 [Candidatus Lambdaproteobacteria bacterium]|nr:hypothetical protein [Candidatus Lambdaproteobacteria bacterium]